MGDFEGDVIEDKGQGPVPLVANSLEAALFVIFNDYVSLALRPFYDTTQDDKARGESTTDTEEGQFRSVWNELSHRATTMVEDVPFIFANLLNFRTIELSKMPAEQRLQAILWHLEILPIELLYNQGPRLKPSVWHETRWVPTVPGANLMRADDVMRLFASSLWTQKETAPETQLYLFDKSLLRPKILYVHWDAHEILQITSYHDDGDGLDPSLYEGFCIMHVPGYERRGEVLAGARVFIKQRQEWASGAEKPAETESWYGLRRRHHRVKEDKKLDHIMLTAVYDCPVELRWVDREHVPEDVDPVTLFVEHGPGKDMSGKSWKMEILCCTCRYSDTS